MTICETHLHCQCQGPTDNRMLISEFYRVTNQIYQTVTQNTSSAKLGNQAVPNG